jgi:hypothetical protein
MQSIMMNNKPYILKKKKTVYNNAESTQYERCMQYGMDNGVKSLIDSTTKLIRTTKACATVQTVNY